MTDDYRDPDAKRITFDEMASRAQYEWQRAEDAEAECWVLARQIETLREALRPFADAWDVALQQAGDHPGSLRTLGPLGALAAHQITGIHFQRARAALARTGEG